ncbi:MAG: glycosyl hydrolase, partial [Saprospiraceae bacterium]|nr:glycosyl hydrolase [Saprospiraceae bacterium]
KMRNIGPAMTSGRIADIAIDPTDQNTMYVAAGSGNLWKTENAGTTWKPIFEKYGSYSLGCITIDPQNPYTLWLGTGENVGGRHVGFGDGIYVSHDAGKSWSNKGLKKTEHLSKIIVHPTNSNVLWVAAQGPLWSKGGERGLYKTTDGGETWEKTLGDDAWTGVTDIVIDPRNPDVLYAATWQRHRTVAAYLGGGPKSGVHRSIDGGKTWTKLTSGLPSSNLGKTGLAICPFNPDRIYAVLEEVRLKGGLYMSEDRGASWKKQSDMVSGGTGPHYYQELYADPHHEGRLYLMNNVVKISDDYGKTYRSMNEDKKHVDTHAMAFRSSDPQYVVMGTDGGVYESFDQTQTWRFVRNLPLVQYYKVAVDDAEPFYNIYGGTQDNGSHGGPSRTMKSSGIHNSDWRVVLGADGHQSATEPGNPNITYGEFQQGWLFRIDHTTGESTFIQPQGAEGDPAERFNWDAPILVSPHSPTRLYFASQRVWRSDNRGDDWTAVSGDLTRDEERLSLPIMGKTQSWDNAWDVGAMSNYNTITSLSESPIREGLLYAGTDDGIIQVSADGGDNWTKIELGDIKGIPAAAFVNDVRADLFEAETVYAALDNHKNGDYRPYLMKSNDQGKTWQSIVGDLPEKLLVWRLVQDHVQQDLLFIATEYGLYFTINGGTNWVKLKGGLPTISFRDITIQRRENDLVGASFGRGFYVLDDYSPLRELSPALAMQEAALFDVREAYWYSQLDELYGQGNSEYAAENPPYGATFTYFLKDKIKSLGETRKEAEKELSKEERPIPFPGWEALEKETRQEEPAIFLTIEDAQGNLVRQIKAKNAAGINRVSWDLALASKDVVRLQAPGSSGGFFGGGAQAVPGTYSVTLSKFVDGAWSTLAGPKEFEVVPLKTPSLPGAAPSEIAAFQKEFNGYRQELTSVRMDLSHSMKKLSALRRALASADRPSSELMTALYQTKQQFEDLDIVLNGLKSKNEVGERNAPSAADGQFIGFVALGGTYGPTGNHKAAFARSVNLLKDVQARLKPIVESLPELERKVRAAGAPPIEGF